MPCFPPMARTQPASREIPMKIEVHCPSCQVTLRLPDESLRGKAIRCPKCGEAVRVPIVHESEKRSAGNASGKAATGKKSQPQHDAGNRVRPGSDRKVQNAAEEFFDETAESEYEEQNPGRQVRRPVRSRPSARSSVRSQTTRTPARRFPWVIVVFAFSVAAFTGLAGFLLWRFLPEVTLDSVDEVASGPDDTLMDDTVEDVKGRIAATQDDANSLPDWMVSSAAQLQLIGFGLHNFHDTHKNFPIRKNYVYSHANLFASDGKPNLSWRVYLMPFLDRADLYMQFHLDEPWDSAHNRTLLEKMPDVYVCTGIPSQPGYTCIQMPSGTGTVMEDGKACGIPDITDGTTNTVMVVMAMPSLAVPWTKPEDYGADPKDAINGLFFDSDSTLLLSCAAVVHRYQRNKISTVASSQPANSSVSALFTKAAGDIPDVSSLTQM